MGVRAWLIVASLICGVAAAGGAVEPDRAAVCGHLEELAAARRALETGDSATAVRHLRRADELLAQCMRDGVPIQSGSEGEDVETRSG